MVGAISLLMEGQEPTQQIVPVSSGELEQEQKGEIVAAHHWSGFGYKIIVAVRRKTVGLEVVESPDHVVGQAIGMRDDGKTFFGAVDLPWIWVDGYDWKPTAKGRLDTFLDAKCACDSTEAGTFVCEMHIRMNRAWKQEDSAVAAKNSAAVKMLDNMPLTGVEPGPVNMFRVLNLDYPWVRLDTANGDWVCFICKRRERSFLNPSYKNVFIYEHAKCGFETWKIAETVLPDAREKALREAVDMLKDVMNRHGYTRAGEIAIEKLSREILLGGDPGKYLE